MGFREVTTSEESQLGELRLRLDCGSSIMERLHVIIRSLEKLLKVEVTSGADLEAV